MLKYIALLFISFPLCVFSIAEYCDRSLSNTWCSAAAELDSGDVTFSNNPNDDSYTPELPTVIRGGETLMLGPGDEHMPGVWYQLNAPSIILREHSSLVVRGGDGLEEAAARLGGHIFLCDNASLVVENAFLRFQQDYEYQRWIWADGQSTVTMTDSVLSHLSDATLTSSPSEHGNMLWWFRSASSLVTSNISGARLSLDVRQVAVMDDATAVRVGETGLSETYIAGAASVEVRDCEYFDVFFSVCKGDSILLDDLPDLCATGDNDDGVPLCNSLAHVPTTYTLAPPQVAYNYTIVNSKIFSWAVESLPGSTTTLKDVGAYANFGLGLQVATTQPIVGVVDGGTGPQLPDVLVDDHGLSVQNSTILVVHVWGMQEGTRFNLLPGSAVGDFLSAESNVTLVADDTRFFFGQTIVQAGNRYELSRCQVEGRVRVDSGSILSAAGATTFTGPVTVLDSGLLVLYDTLRPSNLNYVGTSARTCLASLMSPAFGNDPVELNVTDTLPLAVVNGCFGQAGYIGAGAEGQLIVIDNLSGEAELLSTVDGPHSETTEVALFNASQWPGRSYTIVYLTNEDAARGTGTVVGSRRTVLIDRPTPAPTPVPTPQSSPSTSSSTDSPNDTVDTTTTSTLATDSLSTRPPGEPSVSDVSIAPRARTAVSAIAASMCLTLL